MGETGRAGQLVVDGQGPWTDKASPNISTVDDAEEMGAQWEGDERVTCDAAGFM